MQKLSTTTLLKKIKSYKTIDDVLAYEASDIDGPTLCSYMNQLLEQSHMGIPELAKQVLLDRSYVYQLFNGIRTPNRNTLIRLAFAFHLSIKDAQYLLTLSRRGELYPRIRYDAAILFALAKGYDLYDANEMLEQIGEIPLLQ